MTKRPNILAISTKGDAARAAKSDVEVEINRDVSEEIPSAVTPPKSVAGKPLPKVTLYAHKDVLTAIRVIAANDGVQAQEILREAMQAYLEKRGYPFTDLVTGQKA